MKISGIVISILVFLLSSAIPAHSAAQEVLYTNVKKSTVLIASFDRWGKLIGRGSGFYVDEGIVITNIHVIGGAARYYRIFTTSSDDAVDMGCFTDITRSDIKVNLEDDIAYVRVFVDCPHGSVFFAQDDPEVGDGIEVFGYPALSGIQMVHSTGSVVEEAQAGIVPGEVKGFWLRTDARIHRGNSGGPVVKDGLVVGVAVAAHIDQYGNAVDGFFIPVSQILRGLEYANNSAFAYTPQFQQRNEAYIFAEKERREAVPAVVATVTQVEGKESASAQPEDVSQEKETAVPVVASPIESTPKPKEKSTLQSRVCLRAVKRFADDQRMWKRVNTRIEKRFGFTCSR